MATSRTTESRTGTARPACGFDRTGRFIDEVRVYQVDFGRSSVAPAPGRRRLCQRKFLPLGRVANDRFYRQRILGGLAASGRSGTCTSLALGSSWTKASHALSAASSVGWATGPQGSAFGLSEEGAGFGFGRWASTSRLMLRVVGFGAQAPRGAAPGRIGQNPRKGWFGRLRRSGIKYQSGSLGALRFRMAYEACLMGVKKRERTNSCATSA